MSSKNKAPVRNEQADVLVAYLRGQSVEVNFNGSEEKDNWEIVSPYKYPTDVFRLSCNDYSFRIKQD